MHQFKKRKWSVTLPFTWIIKNHETQIARNNWAPARTRWSWQWELLYLRYLHSGCLRARIGSKERNFGAQDVCGYRDRWWVCGFDKQKAKREFACSLQAFLEERRSRLKHQVTGEDKSGRTLHPTSGWRFSRWMTYWWMRHQPILISILKGLFIRSCHIILTPKIKTKIF